MFQASISNIAVLKLVLLVGIEPTSAPYQDAAKNHSATEGLKLAEPMGAAPTLYLARQASVNAV